MYCFGPNTWVLMIARAGQGASAAIMDVVGLAVIVDTMGANKAGVAMGWRAVAMFAGVILGSALSGSVFDVAGHYAVFTMAFAVLATDIVFRCVMIEREVALQWAPKAEAEACGIQGGTCNRGEHDGETEVLIVQKDHNYKTIVRESVTIVKEDDDNPVDESKKTKLPTIFFLLKNLRLLVAVGAILIWSILLSSVETVCTLPRWVFEHSWPLTFITDRASAYFTRISLDSDGAWSIVHIVLVVNAFRTLHRVLC